LYDLLRVITTTDVDEVSFAAWVRSEMDARGWQQADLAEAADVTQQSVSRWMNGQSTPNGVHARALARAFGVPTDEVVDLLAAEAALRKSAVDPAAELEALRQRVAVLERQAREQQG
jgi:transcriptional regulator with XRE-family HTH domain